MKKKRKFDFPKDWEEKIFPKIQVRVNQTINRQSSSKSRMISFYEYYFSNQWDPSTKSELQLAERPALTFNYSKKPIDFLTGILTGMNMVPKALPTTPAGQNVANTLSAILHMVDSKEENQINIDDATFDMLVTGLGLIRVIPDFSFDPNGQVRYQRMNPLYHFWDTKSESKTYSDARFIFDVDYIVRDDLIGEYGESNPEAAKKLEDAIPTYTAIGFEMAAGYLGIDYSKYYATGGQVVTPKEQALSPDTELFQRIRYQEYYWSKDQVIKNQETGHIYTLPGQLDDAEVRAKVTELNEKYGQEYKAKKGKNLFDLDTVNRRKVRVVEYTNDIILMFAENPFDSPFYDDAPMWCKKSGPYFQGQMEDMVDPQKEINSRKSLTLEILSQLGVNNYWFPKGAATDIERQALEKQLKKRNQLLPIRLDFGGEPKPVVTDAVQKLQLIMALEQRTEQDLNSISMMTDAIQGIVPKKIQAGRAIQRLQEWASTVYKPITRNWIVGRTMIAMVALKVSQLVFGPERMLRVENMSPDQGAEPYHFMSVNVETELGTLNALQYDDYEVQMTITEGSPTEVLERFAQMLRAREVGIPIPDEYIIWYSDLPDKFELLKDLQKAKAQMAQQQQEQQNARTQLKQRGPQPVPATKPQ